MKFSPPRGMRDFYPEDMAFRNHLFRIWRETAVRFGFREYDAPVVETGELLTRKSGEEIVEQIYAFEDKSGRRLALRPEMTPSLARMIVTRQQTLKFPLKWFAIPQCFRYERMATGRKREHYQWNLDIVGHRGVEAEMEVIAAATESLRKLGLDHEAFQVRVGSRSLLTDLLDHLDIEPEYFDITFLALDKRGKIGDDEVHGLLEAEGLSAGDAERIFSLLSIQSLEEVESLFSEGVSSLGVWSPESLRELRELFDLSEAYGLKEYLIFDISIVRGLDYYTGIVFEAFDTGRKLRAIFGGGRYDNLLEFLGGSKIPSVGLGFGDVVVKELLDMSGCAFSLDEALDVAVGFMSESERMFAIRAGNRLRGGGRSVDIALKPEKPGKFFRRAGAGYFRSALYVGPDEMSTGMVKIKDLRIGEQREVAVEDLGRDPAG